MLTNTVLDTQNAVPSYQLGADDSGSSDASEEPHSEDALSGPGLEGTLAYTFEASPVISSQESGLLARVLSLCQGLQRRAADYQRTTEQLLDRNSEYRICVEQLLERYTEDQCEIKFLRKLLGEYEDFALKGVDDGSSEHSPSSRNTSALSFDLTSLNAELRGMSKDSGSDRGASKDTNMPSPVIPSTSQQPLMSLKEVMDALQICEQELHSKYRKERAKRKQLEVERDIALEEQRFLVKTVEKQAESLKRATFTTRGSSLDSYEMNRLFEKAQSIDSNQSTNSCSSFNSGSQSGRPSSKASYKQVRARLRNDTPPVLRNDPPPAPEAAPSFLQSLLGNVAGSSEGRLESQTSLDSSGRKEGVRSSLRWSSNDSNSSKGSRASSSPHRKSVTFEDGRRGDSTDDGGGSKGPRR